MASGSLRWPRVTAAARSVRGSGARGSCPVSPTPQALAIRRARTIRQAVPTPRASQSLQAPTTHPARASFPAPRTLRAPPTLQVPPTLQAPSSPKLRARSTQRAPRSAPASASGDRSGWVSVAQATWSARLPRRPLRQGRRPGRVPSARGMTDSVARRHGRTPGSPWLRRPCRVTHPFVPPPPDRRRRCGQDSTAPTERMFYPVAHSSSADHPQRVPRRVHSLCCGKPAVRNM